MALDALFRVVRPHLPACLVREDLLGPIGSLAARIPAASIGIIECRLGQGQAGDVDLSACYSRYLPTLAPEYLNSADWQDVLRFWQSWTDGNSDVGADVVRLWLEFDCCQLNRRTAIPCWFLHLDQGSPRSPNRILDLASRLKGSALEPLQADLLGRCAKQIIHLGIMSARGQDVFRLVLSGVSASDIPSFLSHLGWRDDASRLEHLLALLEPLTGHLYLDVDVSSSLGSRIGIECFIPEQAPLETASWARLLDPLTTDRAACTREQAEALLAWPGIDRKASCADRWPAHLARWEAFAGANYLSLILRKISHLKVVLEPGQEPLWKAYLQFSHMAFDKAALGASKQIPAGTDEQRSDLDTE